MTDFAAIDFETANECPSSVCSVGLVVVRDGVVTDRFYSLIHPEPDYFQRFCMRVHGLTEADCADAPIFPEVWKQVAPLIVRTTSLFGPVDREAEGTGREYGLECRDSAEECREAGAGSRDFGGRCREAGTTRGGPFYDAVPSLPLVAHNSPFDEGCLRAVFRTYSLDYPDYRFLDTLRASRRHFGPRLENHQLQTVAAACGFDLLHHHHALADAEACAAIALRLL